MRLDPIDCHLFEVECVRHSLKLARSHAALQPALNRAMYLSCLVEESATLGIAISNVISHDFAAVLWDQGDMMASIRMLRQLKDSPDSDKQAITVSRPALLADMVCGS
jgi:serine-protein kinase ATM